MKKLATLFAAVALAFGVTAFAKEEPKRTIAAPTAEKQVAKMIDINTASAKELIALKRNR
ncbi:MAG: hypothetical protein ABIP64_16510 [Burkholderiales bacterium]